MHEKHTFLSKVPTGLSAYRFIYGVEQVGSILGSVPEERGWNESAKTALAAITDLFDGPFSRRWGSTKGGATVDRLADVAFCTGGEVALALNGEISPIHPIISIGREVAVNALRISAESKKRTIPVGSRGRQKTAIKMSTISAARSPLSKEPDLIESMASLGTAFSVLSFGIYLQKYLSGNGKTNRHANTPRNGQAREKTASINTRVVDWIKENHSWVKPDHLTLLGLGLVEGSLVLALKKPEWSAGIAAGPLALGGIVDGWDGKLARDLGLNSLKGMIRDVQADKFQEITTALTNSLLANRRGNRVAATHYALGAMTATLPAYFRASAESKGYIVSEDASGSRVTRGIEGGVGLGLHRSAGIANTISALMVAGNVITAAQRAEVARSGNFSPHYLSANKGPEFMSQAATRKEALKPFVIGGVAVGAWLLRKIYTKDAKI